MSSPQLGTAESRAGAARAFARSLNILLKYVRLYGIDHKLTVVHLDIAWRELCAAMPADASSGFLFGVSGSKLLLDGVPLETGPAERSFAQMLAAAGLASIYFSVQLIRDDFLRLVEAFANAGARPAAIAGELKRAFGENNGPIRVNEIRYVAHDGSVDSLPSQLASRALGGDSEKLKDWLSDPQKMLQLIAAAEGEHSGSGSGTGTGAGNGTGSGTGGGRGGGFGAAPLKQDDVTNVLKLLSQLGKVLPAGGAIDPADLRSEIQNSPVSVQNVLQTALAQMATQVPAQSDPNLLLKIAEHLAIQFALERFEKGEVRVNAVRELLDRMGNEIETLRKVLREHEEKMGRAGMMVESYAELLDRQFWAAVPENGKRAVLLSPDAWCIPPRNIRDYVKQLLDRRDLKAASAILDTYSSSIKSADPEARRRTAMGLSELAELYAQTDPELLRNAIQRTGEQLQSEPGLEAQSLLSATLVRLTQEAATRSDFLAISQALDCTDRLAKHRAELGTDVRRRIAVESRMHKFVSEVLLEPDIPAGFVDMLRREGRAAADELAAQYSRCNRRESSDRLVELARSVGPEAVERLVELLRSHPASKAVACIGLLSHLDAGAVRALLPDRLPQWGRSFHDAVVHQIGMGAIEERGPLLLELLDLFDPSILPAVTDEIGVTSDPLATVRLLRLAQGDLPPAASPYVQVKAIEALSRLHDTHAAPLLHELLGARGLLGWKHPRELRIVAAQALIKLEPGFLVPARSGLTPLELKLAPLDPDPARDWVRQRRYFRIATERALPAFLQTSRGRCGVRINSLSLGGGKGEREGRVNPGTEATLNLQIGMRNLSSRVLVRDAGDDDMAFEIIHINLDDRLRLRRLLLDQVLHRARPTH
ncbi:MAG: hypothetical protein ACLP2H_08150 [Terriglobales bacterium]